MSKILKPLFWIFGLYFGGLLARDASLYFIRYPDHFVRAGYQNYLPMVLVHLGGGILTVLIGPFQFWSALRNKYPRVHRAMGRIYLSGVGIGGIGAAYMTFYTFGGFANQLGFGLFTIGWLLTGAMAFWRIRHANVAAHREWMIRNYALTLGPALFRSIYRPLLSLFLNDGGMIFTAGLWIALLGNLLVAELIIQRKHIERGSSGR